MPLPAGFTANIQNFTVADFWNKEPKVNGLWNAMFSLNIHQTLNVGSNIIFPESVLPGVQDLRSDLTVARLTTPTGRVAIQVLYEGKKHGGKTFDKIADQLHDYLTNLPWNASAWTIGARGQEFKIWFWDGQNLIPCEMAAGGVVTKYRNDPFQGPTYDLAAIVQGDLQGLLNHLMVNPIVTPP